MSEQQGDRIQGISTKVPIVNQIHFTRLFVLELIHVCQGDITHLRGGVGAGMDARGMEEWEQRWRG